MKTVGGTKVSKPIEGCGIIGTNQLNDSITLEASKQNSSARLLYFFRKKDKETDGSSTKGIRHNLKIIVMSILFIISFNSNSFSQYFLSMNPSASKVCSSTPSSWSLYCNTTIQGITVISISDVYYYYALDGVTWTFIKHTTSASTYVSFPELGSSYRGDVRMKARMEGSFINYCQSVSAI